MKVKLTIFKKLNEKHSNSKKNFAIDIAKTIIRHVILLTTSESCDH